MEGPLDLFGAKAFFGIVGDRQASGLSSTARAELGVFRDGSKGHVGALRVLRAGQKFNTDTSPGPTSLALLLPLPFSHCPPTLRYPTTLFCCLHSFVSSVSSPSCQALHYQLLLSPGTGT